MPVWIGFGAMLKGTRGHIGRLALGVVGVVGGGLEMPIPGVHIECRRNPILYSQGQIDEACRVAFLLQRGRLVLLVEPEGSDWKEEREA